MSDRPTVTEVVAKLNTYGSADQLAAFFEQEGVTGERAEAHHCPVALYVKGQNGGEASVWRGGVSSLQRPDDRVHLDHDCPLSQFIGNFDAGDYPALEVHAC